MGLERAEAENKYMIKTLAERFLIWYENKLKEGESHDKKETV